MICKKCNTINQIKNALFCSECGSPLKQIKIGRCPNISCKEILTQNDIKKTVNFLTDSLGFIYTCKKCNTIIGFS